MEDKVKSVRSEQSGKFSGTDADEGKKGALLSTGAPEATQKRSVRSTCRTGVWLLSSLLPSNRNWDTGPTKLGQEGNFKAVQLELVDNFMF